MPKQQSDTFNIIKNEYIKCKTDPVHFMNNHCWIQHPIRGRQKFKLYPFQEDIVRSMVASDNLICNKSRQLGLSTVIAGLSLWMIVFNSDVNIIAVATKQSTAVNIITKVKYMYDNLPPYLTNDPGRASGKKGSNVIDDNKLSLKLRNNSQIKALSASKDAVRSEAVSILILDEAAFIRDIDEIYKAAKPALATGGKIIAISSPNGVGNWFYNTFTDAQNNKNNYVPWLLPWDVHPERDQAWLDKEAKDMSEDEVNQEYKCSFLASGNNVVGPKSMEYIASQIMKPKEVRGINSPDIWIWGTPQPGRKYILTSDVARGDGKDYSTIHVFDMITCEQMLEFQGKLSPTDLARLAVSIGYEWNTALVVMENNGLSYAGVEALVNMNYPNIYYTVRGADHLDHNDFTKKYANNNKVPGFSNTPRIRPLLIGKLQEYTRNNDLLVRSSRLETELRVFIWHNGKAQAMNGCNDDLVIPACIFLYVRDTYAEFQTNYDASTRAMLNNIQKSDYNGVYKTGYAMNNPYQMQANPYIMQINNNQTEDLRWILQ